MSTAPQPELQRDPQVITNMALTKQHPAWYTCLQRAIRDTIGSMVYTALCGLELVKIQEEQKAEGQWMLWLERSWPLSVMAANMRVRLGLELNERLETIDPHDAEWFRDLATNPQELSHNDRERAVTILREIAPASTARSLFAECGVLQLPPKLERGPAEKKEPRPPKPPTPPHVKVGKAWEKLPSESRMIWVMQYREEIEELLALLRNEH
jgi:hypothetical protein